MINKNNFKEQRLYDAVAVDNEIAILEQSRNFWRKKAEELLAGGKDGNKTNYKKA